MNEAQKKVQSLCKKNNLSSSVEHRVLDVVSELGELSKEILKASNYGKSRYIANEKVKLEYKSQLNDKLFSNMLDENMEKDRLSFNTSSGIHKDDIIFHMNGHNVKKVGSQGQQKSFLISLKLAQFDFITNKLGFKPILLLDDIFDKLDDKRVEKLISFTSNGTFSQIFITDTHEDRSKNILNKTGIDFKIFKIQN